MAQAMKPTGNAVMDYVAGYAQPYFSSFMPAPTSSQENELVGIEKCISRADFEFEKSIETELCAADIEPWSANSLIQERLHKQAQLARVSPLRFVPVVDGLHHFKNATGKLDGMRRHSFVKGLRNLLKTDKVELEDEILEAMDYDGSEALSIGEWAVGLTFLFKGTPEEKAKAIFELLDQDQDGFLSKEEIKEFVTPYVKAMIPPQALPLRPHLLEHCGEEVRRSMMCKGPRKVSQEMFIQWLCKNDVVDFLAKIIDKEAYTMFLNSNYTASTPRFFSEIETASTACPSDISSTADSEEILGTSSDGVCGEMLHIAQCLEDAAQQERRRESNFFGKWQGTVRF
eukprot:gnl/MRDRNA2_/MRDRNA2_81093_c0_seq1.p1 gnl/MRDRNA2_/MRDRNA2_81093_c0~~gnl/MRDRNA2_/MRDRNA2_81093_c0_seq1.p1  ORF type:complete len:364 (-),score=78.01 gnl/MRDRNA2_/MRDRNA2_81093_c0_seq1:192-1220(-)